VVLLFSSDYSIIQYPPKGSIHELHEAGQFLWIEYTLSYSPIYGTWELVTLVHKSAALDSSRSQINPVHNHSISLWSVLILLDWRFSQRWLWRVRSPGTPHGFAYSLILKVEAIFSSETLEFLRTTRYNPWNLLLHFNIIHQFTPRSSKLTYPCRLYGQNFTCISHFRYACYMRHSTHPSSCDHRNNIW
jgi:hypothetical protein